MPTPCVIRFTDDNGERQAHVHRRDHGHPEEVITNLSSLQAAIEPREDPAPGNVAAQFVFLDKLWLVMKDVPIAELEEELWAVLYSPMEAIAQAPDSYLHQHAILDSTTEVDDVSFLYEIAVGDSEWEVRIGHNSESVEGPVDEVFQLVSWGFEGELSVALGRFQ